MRLDHLVEEQLLTIHVERDLAQPALLNRIGEINRQRFVRVIEQVLDEFDTPGERVRIAAVQIALGSFAPDDLHRAEARLRERLRAALAVALRQETAGTAARERESRTLVAAFEHYLLHGTWPIGNAIAFDTSPADLLGQLIAEDPLALVAMLRRRGTSDALLRRLVQQMPEGLLAALLHRLEPVHAAYVLAYLGEVRERHAAERLIPASPAQLAEMLWTIVLRDALQESGLQANRKAFLLRLLRQLARSGGTTLAALIAQLRRGLPRMLARRRAPGSLVAVLGELIADEPGLLAGTFGISELAALLGRHTLSARERREAGRLVELADPRQLRWLLRRLAGEDPARLASAIEGVLPLGHALGAIWSIEVAGLPAAIEALAEGRAERAALLALAARSAERSETAARLATALIARMRNSAADQISLPAAKNMPAQRGERPGALARLLAAFAEAAEHPSPSDLAHIREMLAVAMATDPLAARQMLRNFAAADPQRLCLLLDRPDAPEVIGQLLAPHLHATLAALARAAHCSPAEWRALFDVAAGTADSDLPEMLLAEALEALARTRRMPATTLRARLAAEASGMGIAEREMLAPLWATSTRSTQRLAALEQFAFFWSGKNGLAPGEAAAMLARLLPHLSGLAPGMLRARLADENRHEASASLLRLRPLPRSALLRLALLLSGAKAELHAIPPKHCLSPWRHSSTTEI
ncbi:contractile injection system tape measure protein [Sphingomonas sp. 7/4-4]|uniref:contractile injection system tape measure protein n=1 Tax=Sphingomonas sp. 7/4-4 TaxID=3018446 RepID=UPI0022F3E4DA|nr:contractile injection system tape measure protein [Sphingomonas sp. 7/4-4]WBY09535.1 contractile injection system tape measure protein [Sphingomonas sp. 7/4-4]